MRQLFYYKNATIIYYKTRQIFSKKLRQLYYQMWHFLQYATFITKCIDTLRKPLIENDLPTLYINNFEITRESITKSLGIYI